jgi:hypothetical protein
MATPISRPSPTESATLFAVGTKRKGNDGRQYIVAETNAGVKRWVHVTTEISSGPVGPVKRRVYIVDNGGVPMVVELRAGNIARVMRRRAGLPDDLRISPTDATQHGQWLERWRDFKYVRALVGLDPSEIKKKKQGLLGRLFPHKPSWWHGGSALLLELGPNRYLSVCWTGIREFRTPAGDDITGFVSVMGNNAVPYPYAIGRLNTYLVSEDVFIPNVFLAATAAANNDGNTDPYHAFYRTDLVTGMHVKNMQKQRKLADVFRQTHRIPGNKLLHPRHEPK